MDKNQLIMQWWRAQEALETARLQEAQLRQQIVREVFPSLAAGFAGSERFELGSGYAIEAGRDLHYSFGRDSAAVHMALNKLRKIPEVGDKGVSDLVGWKPRLRVAVYNKLQRPYQDNLNQVLTITPAMPTVKLITPWKGKS